MKEIIKRRREKMPELDYEKCREPVEFYIGKKCSLCDMKLFWGFCEEGEFKKNYEECPICGKIFCVDCLPLHILGRHFYGSAKKGFDLTQKR